MTDLDLDELRAELDDFAKPQKKTKYSPREERIIAGFEDIQRFVEEHRRSPVHGEDRDIFERLYAVRLDRIRAVEECRALLEPTDHQGLLSVKARSDETTVEEIDEEELLQELAGVEAGTDVRELRHVKSSVEKRAAEDIANRQKCSEFRRFEPIFKQVQKELDAGLRETKRFERKSEIEKGRFYIVGGQKAYVAEMGEAVANEHGNIDARLRVIFDNGTESNLLMRSLQRALQQDPTGRRIIEPNAGPLFACVADSADTETGTVYVLRSRSDHPEIKKRRDFVHKIGITGGKLETRLANAHLSPTFLMADVEIVATYELYNVERAKLENLIHRFFAAARLDLHLDDRFGQSVRPREWFLVPLSTIDEAILKIQEGTISSFYYDPKNARLEPFQPLAPEA